MAWQTLSEDSLKEKLAGAEVSALQAAALASGQSNPVPNIIARAIDEVRGYIAAGGYALETGSTVPSKLVDATLTFSAWRAALRLNVKAMLSQERADEYRRAQELLNRVADGKFAIEEPTTEDSEVLGAISPHMHAKTRNFTSTTEDGL